MYIHKAYNNSVIARKKLLGCSFKNYLIQQEYGIKSKCVTTENMQAKYILEKLTKLYQTLYIRFNYK